MNPRLLSAIGVGWIAAACLIWSGLRWTGVPRHPPRPPGSSALARALNASAPDERGWRWSVTRARASQGALVAEVDLLNLEDAPASARTIIEPVRANYSEVLLYFRNARSRSVFASRRVQWTPQRGYVETRLDDAP